MLWLTCDGETTKSPLRLESSGLSHSGLSRDHYGIYDETVLESLHLGDHLGLLIWRAVVVDYTKTTLQSHMDGHLMLSDSVHGRGDKGDLEGDSLCDGGIESDLGGREANVSRQEQEVIVGKTSAQLGVHQVLDTEAITTLKFLENVEGLSVVEDLGRAIDTVGGRHLV